MLNSDSHDPGGLAGQKLNTEIVHVHSLLKASVVIQMQIRLHPHYSSLGVDEIKNDLCRFKKINK